jgi:hypothetical protein
MTMRVTKPPPGGRSKRLRSSRRGIGALVAGAILLPMAAVSTLAGSAPPAGAASAAASTTALSIVTLVDSTSPTLRATVAGASTGSGTPTGTVTFTIVGADALQCDDLTTDTVQMSGGVATCKITSGLPASGTAETAQAIYSGDDAFTSSAGTVTSSDGSFTSSPPLVVTPPASIPHDCSSDAAPALDAWFSSLPQGSAAQRVLVRFPAQACYVVNETLLLQGATDLTIDGNGSSFEETVSPTTAAPIVELWEDTSLTMRNMTIDGDYGGSGNGENVDEGDYGFVFEGDTGVDLTDLQVDNIQGDFLYLSPPYDITNSTDALNSNISVTDSTFTNAGYHGLTVQSVDGLTVSQDTFDDMGVDAMDFEYDDYSTPFNPDGTPYWAAQDNVTISDNTWENWNGSDWFASVQGQDPGVQEQNLTITDNYLESDGPVFEVVGTDPRTTTEQSTDANWTISGNSFAPGYYGEPYRGGISQASQIYNVANLTFTDNTFPLCAGTYESPQPFSTCSAPDYYEMDLNVITGGFIAGNDFLGAEGIVQPQPYDQDITDLTQCSNTYATGAEDGPC